MKIFFCASIILILMASSGRTQKSLLPMYRNVRDLMLNIIGRSISEPRLLNQANRAHRLQKRMPKTYSFPCSDYLNRGKLNTNLSDELYRSDPTLWIGARSKERPTSVHTLRPGDIDIVAALGDSLTSANGAGAMNILQVYTENRGVAWSIGGEGTWREFMTLPNILKEFNPKLFGYSLEDSLGHQSATQFNAAEIGACSVDLPFMALELVRRLKYDPRVDMENDWKIITIMIGANDICSFVCYRENPYSALDDHRKDLYKTIMNLKENIPRLLVNLVPGPKLEILANIQNVPPVCLMSQRIECSCFFGEPNKSKKNMLKLINEKWIQIDMEISNHPDFHDKEDFTVVTQPFDVNITFPLDKSGKTDLSYLSQDCFHFSQRSHALAGNALWNNMLQPVGQKSTNWNKLFKKFICPTDDNPFIYTLKNSKNAKGPKATDFLQNNLIKRNANYRTSQ